MALYGSPWANLALGLASLRNPGLLSQAMSSKEQEAERARKAEEDNLRLSLLKQQQGAQQNIAGLLGTSPTMAGAKTYGMGQDEQNRMLASELARSGDVSGAMSLLAPAKTEKYAGDVQAYMDAIRSGIIPQDTPFEGFMGMVKKPLIQQTTSEQPYSLADLERISMPGGGIPPLGLVPSEARRLGATLKEKPVAADSAGKQSMLDTVISELSVTEALLFPEGIEGPLNTRAIAGSSVLAKTPGLLTPLVTPMVQKEGQALSGQFERGIQAITRLETGAAMPAAEVDNTRRRFQPYSWDDPEVVKEKWMAYKLFINNAKKYLNPNTMKVDADQALKDAKSLLAKEKMRPLSEFER